MSVGEAFEEEEQESDGSQEIGIDIRSNAFSRANKARVSSKIHASPMGKKSFAS